MGISDNINAPVSPQEWYEAGVLLRRGERFGDAVNAFRRAADLASETLERLEGGTASSAASCLGGSDVEACAGESGLGEASADEAGARIEELRKIRASSLAFIEMINEIRGFVNKDLLNP